MNPPINCPRREELERGIFITCPCVQIKTCSLIKDAPTKRIEYKVTMFINLDAVEVDAFLQWFNGDGRVSGLRVEKYEEKAREKARE